MSYSGGFIMSREIDCRGMLCPKPVILTKKALDEMKEDEQILTIVDNEVARENMSKLFTNLGYNFEVEEKDDLFYIRGVKGSSEVVKDDSSSDIQYSSGNTVVLFDKDMLGHGNDELGKVLVKGFIYTLTEFENKPKTLLFINGGIKLTTEGSEVLEDLKILKEAGVEIFSCGTCLDYYGVADKLAIGEISNMYDIAEKLLNASNTIKM